MDLTNTLSFDFAFSNMAEISLKIEGMDKLKEIFQRFPQIAAQEYDTALDRSAKKIEGDAVRKAPVNKSFGGGTLRQSIGSRKSGPLAYTVAATAAYATYVNFGTRPHVIRAKNAKALANTRTGQFFGKTVNHPGTRAQPFFSDAVKDGEPFINKELSRAISNVISRVTR